MQKKILFILFILLYNNTIANVKSVTLISEEDNTTIKSNTEEDWKQKEEYFRNKVYKSSKKEALLYADSLVIAALNTKSNTLIGNAYLIKGMVYYNQKQLQKALDNYIIANEYIVQTKDQYAIHKVKYAIAQTKYYVGLYHEAIALYRECINYFEEENDRAYLNTLHAIGLCYNKIGKYDFCTYYNNLGLKEGIELQNPEMKPYFNHSEGINQYFKKNYTTAIKSLSEVIPEIQKKKDFANETVAYFYIGKSYWSLKQNSKAIPFFIKVDSAFTNQNYIRPDLIESYELLIDYYKSQKNSKLEIQYMKQLLKVNKLFNQSDKYLSQKILKEYDTKKLLLEKEDSSKFENKKNLIIIASLVCTLGIVLFIHLRNKKKYKAKFEELMNKSSKTPKTSNNNSDIDLDINPELVASVLQNLEKFEKNAKYLEKDMNLTKLAPLLKTNPKYAAKIILKYRGKKIIEYISDLKIDYIIELLQKENKYRLYTNKALGEEAGFGSTQNFTKAFKTRTGMPPTYFILALNKIK